MFVAAAFLTAFGRESDPHTDVFLATLLIIIFVSIVFRYSLKLG